jgi:poly(3-hydroxybutyrate) depolymerase
MFKILFIALILCPIIGFSQVLTNSTSISITKTWSLQPNGYTYPISISVPSGPVPSGGFPVCILLHGNGSQNPGNLAGPPMLSPLQFGSVLSCHILVAPTGFQNSWNICTENSDAPDVDMIKDLVNNLQSYSNVNRNKIRVLGTSNGAGLANRVFIENTNPGIDIVCAIVSHLNDYQYHSGNFYKPSSITNSNSSFCGYDIVASPLTTTKYLSISNENDSLIPYAGGRSNVGATFLPAETAALNIAKYKGYTGSILTSGTVIGSGTTAITEFSYLSGNVVHIKGNAAHQANATQKTYVTDYFSGCKTVNAATSYGGYFQDSSPAFTQAYGIYATAGSGADKYAAWLNGKVLLGSGSPTTSDVLEVFGSTTIKDNLSVNGNINIGSSGTLSKYLRVSTTMDVVCPANSFNTLTITATGAALGDNVILNYIQDIGSLIISQVWVSAANTVSVKVYNPTASSSFPTNYDVRIILTR